MFCWEIVSARADFGSHQILNSKMGDVFAMLISY
jgi:hypothetical protein